METNVNNALLECPPRLLDDGFGATPSTDGQGASKPKGLIITQDSVGTLKGSMHITSTGAEGTLITIRIPKDG